MSERKRTSELQRFKLRVVGLLVIAGLLLAGCEGVNGTDTKEAEKVEPVSVSLVCHDPHGTENNSGVVILILSEDGSFSWQRFEGSEETLPNDDSSLNPWSELERAKVKYSLTINSLIDGRPLIIDLNKCLVHQDEQERLGDIIEGYRQLDLPKGHM
jgi:hypothetical protein